MPSYSRPDGPTRPRRRHPPRPQPASYMGAVASSASYKADTADGGFLQPEAFDFDFQAFPEAATAAAAAAATFPAVPGGLYPIKVDELFHARAASTISSETSSAGSLLSPIQTDMETLATRRGDSRGPSPLAVSSSIPPDIPQVLSLVCLGRQCEQTFPSEDELKSHIRAFHTHTCNWAGCEHPSFASRDGLIWHVKAEHLLVCPWPGCTEVSFRGTRVLRSHIAVAHPEAGKNGIKEWQLSPTVVGMNPGIARSHAEQSADNGAVKSQQREKEMEEAVLQEHLAVTLSKRKCQDQLRSVVEKKARRNVGTPRSADSPTDLVRGKASRLVDTASFPLVFEHAILPFLAEFLSRWAGARHVISVTRGKTLQQKRICIMTQRRISRTRKIIIAGHVQDLLPENIRHLVTFVFTVGQISRMTWARGLSKDHLDDICAPRNPYFFRSPCMGDSIGITGNDSYEDSTATLGPCLIVGGGSFWLGNFHPFVDAYQHSGGGIEVEHPSREDRTRCIEEGHDAMAEEYTFKLGHLEVTSGLNLQTTRVSHDPYWEEMDKEQPLVVTDWALIASRTSHANMLRRFPSETQPMLKEAIVKSTARIVPGADVVSSGRTSGYQRGQICEIPAYVSGDENGTQKATREWFIEEPYMSDDEEAWIRGGIGVEGDSGAAVVDASSNALLGHLWGRNRYWGPGPRLTFFTPIADVFDDIQEKCGQQIRPQLPQDRDEADRYAVHPTCRQCYDLRTYLNSRRSSRISLQSMIMGKGDGDQDLTSIEAVSELATPRDSHRYMGIEEAGSSFNSILSPAQMTSSYPWTPTIADATKSPYAMVLDIGDLYDTGFPSSPEGTRKRPATFPHRSVDGGVKRPRAYE